MALSKGEKDVASFLYCSSILEQKVFLLFKSLSKKIEHPMAESFLLSIAYDSLLHSMILRKVNKNIAKLEMTERNCKKELADIWKMIDAFCEELSKKERVDCEELSLLANTLFVFMQARYTVLVPRLKTLQFMAREIYETYEIDLEHLKGVFGMIIRNEENHREIMMKIKNIFPKKEETVKDLTPKVKYQHPDAWYPVSVFKKIKRTSL